MSETNFVLGKLRFKEHKIIRKSYKIQTLLIKHNNFNNILKHYIFEYIL